MALKQLGNTSKIDVILHPIIYTIDIMLNLTRQFFLLAFILILFTHTYAQSPTEITLSDILNNRDNEVLQEPGKEPDRTGDNESQIKAVIDQMFDGMRAGNAAMLSPLFIDGAMLKSVYADQFGKTQMSTPITMTEFAEAVAKPRSEVWDEKIWSYDISIDGPLAFAWTEYSFYLDEELLHCGVNMFELAQIDQKWKITNITDTRRKTECKEDPTQDINTFMDAWHKAAATADENVFFGSMTEDAIYIGTDISERWTKATMMKDLMQYFTQSQSAWSFIAKDRNIVLSENGEVAWLDEALDTWMGDCRSTAVLVKTGTGWKIQHYQLSMAVPNDKVDGYLQLIGKPRRG